MSTAALSRPSRHVPRPVKRLAVGVLALAAVFALLFVLSLIFGAGTAQIATAPKNPFGTGLREAAPGPSGLGGAILAIQSQFYRSLTAALGAIRQDGAAVWTLLGIGFLYGIFHAAGPGHGKAVVASYLLATRRTLVRGLGLSFAAAMLQAAVAVGIVAIFTGLLNATAASVSAAANAVEIANFAALALFGVALLWRKTARLVPAEHSHGTHDGACDDCGHSHGPTATEVERLTTWRETGAVVLAAGSRPCSGAIIILVFAAAQSMFAAGIAATLAMAFGTAITTGALAAVAVLAKGAALRFASRGGETGDRLIAGLEVLAAAFVCALGALLLLGLWSGGAGS